MNFKDQNDHHFGEESEEDANDLLLVALPPALSGHGEALHEVNRYPELRVWLIGKTSPGGLNCSHRKNISVSHTPPLIGNTSLIAPSQAAAANTPTPREHMT